MSKEWCWTVECRAPSALSQSGAPGERTHDSAARAAEFFEASGFGAFFAEAFGAAFVFHLDEFLADAREASEADDFDWGGGAGFLDGLAAVIEHAFDLA